ncbi:Shedu anti-phage system protein SduA domain-containing protein [Nocardiopsis sp. CA-288880]|uniref:Shedu anti-phage system protein SduA domain-containing protein n=1 Tax=Nocardiopsis sp. CA-288880 TaxID=3239995 RepID=UPI003D990D10
MNMHSLSSDIPLGSFEGVPLRVYASDSDDLLHTSPDCAEPSCEATDGRHVPLTSTLVGKLCLYCSVIPGGGPVTAVGLFVTAVLTVLRTSTRFMDEIDEEGPDEPWAEEEEGEGPWEGADRYPASEEESTPLRELAEDMWLTSVSLLQLLLDAVTRYPWLEPWAQPTVTAMNKETEDRRQAFADLVESSDLLEAAAAFLVRPELPVDCTGFEGLEAGKVRNTFENLRDSWERTAEHHPGEFSINSLTDALRIYVPDEAGEEARESFREIVEGWFGEVRTTVGRFASFGESWVLLTFPRPWLHPGDWWTGTIATYSAASDWRKGAALLRVPELVARRLAEESEKRGITCVELTRSTDTDGTALLSELLRPNNFESTHVLTPGVLDDVPVHERRLLSVEDAALLSSSDPLSCHPYIVFSATHGTEVLYPAALEERCRHGWEGVLLAGVSDLPTALVSPLVEQATARSDARSGEPLTGRNRDHAGDVLGWQEGETWLKLYSRDRNSSIDLMARLLLLARTAPDLRDFAEANSRAFHRSGLNHALLSLHRLDLDPFRPLGSPLFDRGAPNKRGPGLGLPLGHLADVQIYSTDMRQQLSRMGHAPGCQHAPTRFGHGFSLMTAHELMTITPGRWCSTCGGYAVRRLDREQLTYYRVAHELYGLWIGVNQWADRLDSLSKGDVIRSLAELDELASTPFDPRMDRSARERWNGAVREIRIRGERVLRYLHKPNRPAKAKLSRALRHVPETPEEMAGVDVRLDPLLRRHLKVILGRATDPGLQVRISTVLDHLGSKGEPPPGGFALLTLLAQARAHAAEADEWDIVSHLQDSLDFAENRLSKPNLEERHRLLKEGRREGSLLDLVLPQAKRDLDHDIWGSKRFLEKHPDASAKDLIDYFESLYPDIKHIDAPLDRPGRYVISRGRNELSLWLHHVAHNRIDVEDIEETVRRLSLSPEALALVAADKDGELILRAAELRRRKAKLGHLRAKVEDHSAREEDLQKALMGQPWIFGGQYVGEAAHRRLVPGDEVDIPLIRGDGSLHIVELKRSMSLETGLVKRHRGDYIPTSSVNDAIGQAQNYLVGIDEQYKEIRKQFGLETRRASATVLIGHPGLQPKIAEEKINEVLRKRNTVTSRVEVLTYKELLDNAERALDLYRLPS